MDSLVYNKLLTLQEQILALNKKTKELSFRVYPGEEVEAKTKLVLEMVEQLSHKLDTYLKSDVKFEELSILSMAVITIYGIIGNIQSCDMKNHPLEIMMPIKQVLKIINPSHIFITEPRWEFNYAIGHLVNDKYKEILEAGGITNIDNINIIRLIFPKVHQDDILLGAVMSHEFGHYIDLHYKCDLTEKIIVCIMRCIDINKYSGFYQLPVSLEPNKQMILKSKLPNIIMRNWIVEIVADIIGVLLYGPASYLACEHVSIYYCGIDTDSHKFIQRFSGTHPRESFRNTARIKTLEELGFLEKLNEREKEKIQSYSDQWAMSTKYSFQATEVPLGNNDFFTINNSYLSLLENDLIKHIDYIIKIVTHEMKELSKDLIYSPHTYLSNVPKLVDKIINIIPPNEIENNPTDLVSIINAGWMAYLLESDKIKQNIKCNNDNEVKQIVNNLVKKATLSADIHRRWINARTK